MEDLSINSTIKVNNTNSHNRNYDGTEEKLLSNLGTNMDEQHFYDLFMVLEKYRRDEIIKELQLFTQGISDFWTFLNNIYATLANRYRGFWSVSRKIIDYLEYLAKNDMPTLEKIYKKLSQNAEQ